MKAGSPEMTREGEGRANPRQTAGPAEQLRAILDRTRQGKDACRFFEELLLDLAQSGTKPDDPVQGVLKHAGSYWGSAILYILQSGTYRHATLRRLLNVANNDRSISQRILTLTLRTLERDGLIERKISHTMRVSVEYRLTELGHELIQHFKPLVDWAVSRKNQIRLSRAKFDEQIRRFQ
jgi:DNA-binding HxlR family transcriptional regulator